MMPDLFSFWLCGRAAQRVHDRHHLAVPRRGRAGAGPRALLERLSLPTAIFGEIVPPGAVLGDLLPHVAEEAGLPPRPVIAVGGHDTALAVAAVPAAGEGFAYVSSGTWSLLGAEIPAPCIGEREPRRQLHERGRRRGDHPLPQEPVRPVARPGVPAALGAPRRGRLLRRASPRWRRAAPAFRSLVDVDAPDFAAPGDMPARIQAYCRRTGQPVPETKGEIVRAALDSLALKYRYVLAQMEGILRRRLEPLHVVGGGARNRLLCQLAADATGRAVVAGPVEATAAGNVLMQALALGHLGSLAEARDVVRRSFEIATYEPRPTAAVEDAYARLAGAGRGDERGGAPARAARDLRAPGVRGPRDACASD